MRKGYVLEINVTCIATGKKYPDVIIPSDKFGDTFTDVMGDVKIGGTSIAKQIEGLHFENGIHTPVTYDLIFLVTEIDS
jgi:hypothetical protein